MIDAITPKKIYARSVKAYAEISNSIYKTPLLESKIYGAGLLYKAENFQNTGSFKVRGALSKITAMNSSGKLSGVKLITASSGNHGIACAFAASRLGGNLTVVLPENVSPVKLSKIKGYGVTVILHGEESGVAESYAQALAKEDGYIYISPYNDLDVIAGQGTIGLEVIEDLGRSGVNNIFISMGGGGLISGISSVLKAVNPDVKVWGVSSLNSCTLGDSLKAGRIIETDHSETLADGVAGGIDADTVTFDITKNTVDQLLWCDEDEIISSFLKFAYQEHQIVEGSAALALAGYEKVSKELDGETSIVLVCGSNIDQVLAKTILSS